MSLTAVEVRKLLARAPEKRLTVADGYVDGLVLRITPSGAASWSVEYTRPVGGRARYTIGPANEIGLAEAREQALDIRARARRGEDPQFEKRAARLKAEQDHQRVTAGTVGDLAQRWVNSREARSWRPTTRASFNSLLGRHIMPAIGKLPATEVTRADIRALVERVHDQTRIGSNRVFEVVRSMWNWARSKDLLTSSPCDGLKKIEKERRRDRTYTDEELRAISAAVKGTDLEDLTSFLLRTGTRSHEARAARWDEIDFDRRIWINPPEKAKAGRKHEVPLARGAWAILERRFSRRNKEAFVFPAATMDCSTCRESGHVGPPLHRRLKALSIRAGFLRNVGTEQKPKWEGEPIRLHDLRRTVADRMLNILGVAPYVVDLGVLAHAPSGLVRTYMPSGVRLPEVQAAMTAWDAHLDQILEGKSKTKRASIMAIRKPRSQS